jgi:hypothetical protein
VHRYEVFRKWGEPMPVSGCVYKDLFKPWEGNRMFVGFLAKIFGSGRFNARVIASFDVAADEIESIYAEYPYRYHYRYLGPNSNTYTSWLLGQLGIFYILPRSAWGRNRMN